MSQRGYIYFASNGSMPGLLKIGYSVNSPVERLPGLRSTGVPVIFVLEASFRVDDCQRAEKRVHEILANFRLESDREFFRVTLKQALAECLPHLNEFFANPLITDGQIQSARLPEGEENILLFVFCQTKKSKKPTRSEIQQHFKLSEPKLEFVLGNLIQRKMVKQITEERYRKPDGGYDPRFRADYKVKAVQVERRGIQYLLDNKFISVAEM